MKQDHNSKHFDAIKKIIRGELLTDESSRKDCSVDGSIFTIMPSAVFHPRDITDIQAVLEYLYTRSEAGDLVPSLTARGRGSDQAGGPLGNGIILDTLRLNQIIEVGHDYVRVEPGVRYGELQALLKKHGRYLAPYPASIEICSIGGALANNSAGEKTVKYGNTRDAVTEIKAILANGEESNMHALTLGELKEKKRHHTFEATAYRKVESLLHDYTESYKHPPLRVTKNSTGYALWEINQKGKFDLSKLFVGSQGTLGIITEAKLKTTPLPKGITLLVGYFSNVDSATHAIEEIRPLKPSALEVVDKHLLALVNERNPEHLRGLLPKRMPEIVLLAEFDDNAEEEREHRAKLAKEIISHHGFECKVEHDPNEQQRLWNLRRSAAALIWTVKGPKKALPIVEDGIVPHARLSEFFTRAYQLFDKYGLTIAIWGHAGDANLHMQPFMDLSKASDRKKIWPFIDDFHALILELGGSISGEHNDGLLRTPYLKEQYGESVYSLFKQVKRTFDPYNFLNPGKKIGTSVEDIKGLVRHSYDLEHLVDHHETINR